MKGETFEGAKHVVLNINKHIVEASWEILNNGFAIEIVWEALNLFEFYVILLITEYVLQAVEYMFLEVQTYPIGLIEQRSGHGIKKISRLLERGKSRLWQIFREYHILETESNVLKALIIDFKNHVSSFGDFFMRFGCMSKYPQIPHGIKALYHSCCC